MVAICGSFSSFIMSSRRLRQACQNQSSERVTQNANRWYLNSWELPYHLFPTPLRNQGCQSLPIHFTTRQQRERLEHAHFVGDGILRQDIEAQLAELCSIQENARAGHAKGGNTLSLFAFALSSHHRHL